MFTYENLLKIQHAREDFYKNGNEDSFIRPEIMASWKRSYSFNVNPWHMEKVLLSPEEFSLKIRENQMLFDVALPIMQNLYEFVKGSNFMIILTDAKGIVLKTIGDESIMALADKNLLVEGSNRSEQALGTNAVGTCLNTRKPIQVWACEHYYTVHSDWSCSGAPILNEKGILLGSVCLTGTWDKVSHHTLGMAVSAAYSISSQIRLVENNLILHKKNSQLNVMIEALQDGVLLIDSSNKILNANAQASNILGSSKEDLIFQDILSFIPDISFSNYKSNLIDQEVNLICHNQKIKVVLSSSKILDASNQNDTLIRFKTLNEVHKTLHRVSSPRARFTFRDIIGIEKSLVETKRIASIAAKYNSNVLITGESGTGKELFAQAIHNYSSYSNGPFIEINCGAIPRSLLESELFGYEGGSFTGSQKNGRAGKFEMANGGTIFLDEIGEMPFDVQVNLLRVLQNREIIRIGGTTPIQVDIRVIAATNRNLQEAIINKTFRSDLYYRLNVFEIHVPPLRDRRHDIPLLADYFLSKYTSTTDKWTQSISPEVYEVFDSYPWPGNVRELENTMERAVLVCEKSQITLADLPAAFAERPSIDVSCILDNSRPSSSLIPEPDETNQAEKFETPPVFKERAYIQSESDSISSFSAPAITFAEVEKEMILRTLKNNSGNVKKTAADLGISRRTLYRRIDQYGICCLDMRNP